VTEYERAHTLEIIEENGGSAKPALHSLWPRFGGLLSLVPHCHTAACKSFTRVARLRAEQLFTRVEENLQKAITYAIRRRFRRVLARELQKHKSNR